MRPYASTSGVTNMPDGPALVGREPQLATLREALLAATGGAPRVVVVQGEPGMGKTALLDAFVAEQPNSVQCVRIGCDAHELEVPYASVSMLLDDLPEPDTSPVAVGIRLLRLLGELQHRAAAVMVVDDLHWMDEPSAAALRFALRRLRADRVLAVLARRPAAGSDGWASLVADTRLTTLAQLTPLTAAEAAALARVERDWELPPALAERVVQHTGGVPLLLSTFLTGAPDDAAAWAYGDLPVPSTSAAAVAHVLETLDGDARALLCALAVLDVPTPLVQLASLVPVRDAARALAAALDTQLVVIEQRDDVAVIAFPHDLLRLAVYDGMSPATRRELHERAAGLSSGTRSLTHRVAAADRPDPALVRDLVAVAESEAENGREKLAATRLLQARSVTADPAERDELLLRAFLHRVYAGDLKGAASLRESAEDCPPSALRSHALGLFLGESGEVDEAAAMLTQAVAQADRTGDSALAEVASVDLATIYALVDRGAETVQAASRGLGSTDPWVANTAIWTRAVGLWADGDLTGALAKMSAVPRAAAATNHEADAVAVRALLRVNTGDLVGATEDLDAAIRLAMSGRRILTLNRNYVQRSNVNYIRGRWDAAAVDASNACALADAGDVPWDAPVAHGVSVQVPAARGQWDVASEHLELAREGYERLKLPVRGSISAAISLGTAQEAYANVLQHAMPMLEGVLAAPQHTRRPRFLFIGVVEALVRTGETTRAAEILDHYEQLEAMEPGGAGLSRLGWLRGLLAQACGDAAAARAAYSSDLSDPAIGSVPFAHALLLHSAGRLERALGNRREAVDQLRTAREILAQLRAIPYLERCDADLAACGLHQVKQSPLALTAREQDVASLVARGLTNSEAAAQLFVTPKTIEYHLGNVYAKLGITNRRDLRVLLAA